MVNCYHNCEPIINSLRHKQNFKSVYHQLPIPELQDVLNWTSSDRLTASQRSMQYLYYLAVLPWSMHVLDEVITLHKCLKLATVRVLIKME